MDDRVLLQESTVEGGKRKHVEDDQHVERGKRKRKHVERGKRLKSERKHVERGKRLKSKRKRVEGDLVDLKSERKHVERGKRLKSKRKLFFVERVKRPKSKRKRVEDDLVDLKSERKHETIPKFQWDYKQIKISDEDYLRRSRKLGPFDAIPRPPRTLLGGGVVPISITDYNRPRLVKLSEIALEKYNDDNNQVPPFEFDELVKSTIGSCAGVKYFITFKAKQSSNTSATIFQATVWFKLDRSAEVLSCDIKT